jgi:TP901-1 family phage major tail protein
MKKINLQMYGEGVSGKRLVYLYRLHSEAATNDGVALAFVTENTRTKSKESESTVTKDGSITTPGAVEVEISSTSYMRKGDPMVDKLEDALDNDELLDIWEVNLDDPADEGENKFKGRYFQGYLTEFEITASAEEFVELSHTFAINGAGVKGNVTVSTEQQAMAEYVFTDAVKTGA